MSRFTDDLMRPSTTTALVCGDPDRLQRVPWNEIHDAARRTAGGMAERGVVPDSAVAVLAGDPSEVARIAQACWMRGASVTMLHPPTPRADLAEWAQATGRVLAMIEASLLVIGDPYPAELTNAFAGVEVTTVSELADATPIEPVHPGEDAVALLQLTAGTTGTPKAVAITHRNLHAGTAAITDAFELRPERDVAVMWLPLYHDMGMIGLVTLMRHGVPAVFVTPLDFLRRPLLLPELISTYRGTVTTGPDFSYAILSRRLRAAPDGAYDLSSLRVVVDGAEPIDPEVVDEFTTQAARFGMAASAITPAYGMAEATLLVSLSRGRGMLVDTIDPAAIEHRALAEPEPGTGRHLVRLGNTHAAMELRITDAIGTVLPPRAVGEIRIRGAAVTGHYLTSQGRVPATDEDGWLSTGDLGYRTEDGDLVVCGRAKEIIIIAGRNIYPTDIERICAAVPGVRAGNVVAVRIGTATGSEGFVVIAESARAGAEPADETLLAELRAGIATAVQHRLGVTPRWVEVVPPGTLPKTSSGKLRRTAAADLLRTNPALTAGR